jgi:hypothetical protein
MPNATTLEVPEFGGDRQWNDEEHVRLIGDTTGNGLGDIIGFGPAGVFVVRNNGDSFSSPSLVLKDLSSAKGWSAKTSIRYVADLRRKGYVDIIGFADEGVFVSLNNGDGTYAPARLVLRNFGHAGGLKLDRHLLFLADVTGNGILDVVFFGERDVSVALGIGDGTFAPPKAVINNKFTYRGDEWRTNRHPRMVVDLTGDGRADIIGFADHGVCIALNNGDGTFQAPKLVLKDFGAIVGGWIADQHPRFVADITGDGCGDLVGFGDGGVYAAIGNRDGTFQTPKLVSSSFGWNTTAGGWRVDKHPRFVVDLTGDGTADIVGFGEEAVCVAYNDGKGNFGRCQKLTTDFSRSSGWGPGYMQNIRLIANLWAD